jgi:hypothetical protein
LVLLGCSCTFQAFPWNGWWMSHLWDTVRIKNETSYRILGKKTRS